MRDYYIVEVRTTSGKLLTSSEMLLKDAELLKQELPAELSVELIFNGRH